MQARMLALATIAINHYKESTNVKCHKLIKLEPRHHAEYEAQNKEWYEEPTNKRKPWHNPVSMRPHKKR